jgi:hypothetical protein
MTVELEARLEADQPELTLSLGAAGRMRLSLNYPYPFDAGTNEHLVLPMNEGISFPVGDATTPLFRLIAYGGHGICMAFWGVTGGAAGHMGLIETPDDAAVQMSRADGRTLAGVAWDPQKGDFGYARKLRFVFFDRGGHVAMAKRYRAHARGAGLVKTLEAKRQENGNVDRLIGAVNIWSWDRDGLGLARELKEAGLDRILWSNAQPPDTIKAMNEMGILTSRYDIYQDVMDPAQFPRLRWTHPDWTTGAWPKDIILNWRGDWLRGWEVEAKDGGMIPCAVICDSRALDYARERVPADLARHPYGARFIDTTTAAPWNECYHTNHPMTRSQSRKTKMELLDYMSREMKLVVGCETGHDASVPYLHYFEGMMSLGPFRVPDAGRRMIEIWTNVPENVLKYQVGHAFRLPLWELVFHDCTVSQWYWGDYNNKLPAIWRKRDLFNILYGTGPMFMFTRGLWRENREQFIRSYRDICPTIREYGYAEMVDHRFLTEDRSVQQTVFSSGQVVTVNFGATPFRLRDDITVPAEGFHVGRSR